MFFDISTLVPLSCLLIVCSMHTRVTDAIPPSAAAVKPCGEIKCNLFEFCASQHSPHCRHCSEVCAENGPAVNHQICSESCQEYIYEMKFSDWYHRVDADVMNVRKLSVVAIVLGTVALLFIALFLFIYLNTPLKSYLLGLRVSKKKNSSAAAVINAGKHNSGCPVANNNLRIMVPSPGDQTSPSDLPSAGATTTTTFGTASVPSTPYYGKNGAVTPATMSTPISTRPPRHPSEDATLEHAYDNHGLSRSSENVLDESVSPHVTRAKESSF